MLYSWQPLHLEIQKNDLVPVISNAVSYIIAIIENKKCFQHETQY